MDSATPSYHPWKTMIAITLIITTETLMMASRDRIRFPVAISNITKEKQTAAIIPVIADFRNALSVCIQHQNIPAVYMPD